MLCICSTHRIARKGIRIGLPAVAVVVDEQASRHPQGLQGGRHSLNHPKLLQGHMTSG